LRFGSGSRMRAGFFVGFSSDEEYDDAEDVMHTEPRYVLAKSRLSHSCSVEFDTDGSDNEVEFAIVSK